MRTSSPIFFNERMLHRRLVCRYVFGENSYEEPFGPDYDPEKYAEKIKNKSRLAQSTTLKSKKKKKQKT